MEILISEEKSSEKKKEPFGIQQECQVKNWWSLERLQIHLYRVEWNKFGCCCREFALTLIHLRLALIYLLWEVIPRKIRFLVLNSCSIFGVCFFLIHDAWVLVFTWVCIRVWVLWIDEAISVHNLMNYCCNKWPIF